jgi:hypothetical protein
VIKERTNLLVIGTLASGSGALIDMLYEYENINVLRYEFNDYRRPGFVSDQLTYETSVSYPNVIDKNIKFTNWRWKMIYKSSIWKLIPKETLNSIWRKEVTNKKLKDYKNSLTELFQVVFLKELNEGLKSDISFEEKIELSNKWITKVGSIFPSYYDFTLFNQPLHPWSDPAIWTKVFRPFKLICVYRDPKDQLAEMVRRDIAFYPYRDSELSYGQFNIISIYGNDRRGRMKFLKDALIKRLEKIDQWLNVIEPDQILFVDFEGLINNYDFYETHIEQFLGKVNGRHKFRKKYFNPEVAQRKCIGIYKQYLNAEDLDDFSSLEEWYSNKIKSGIASKVL